MNAATFLLQALDPNAATRSGLPAMPHALYSHPLMDPSSGKNQETPPPDRLDRDASTQFLIPFIEKGRVDSVFAILVPRYQVELLMTARHHMGPRLQGRYTPHDIVQEAWSRILTHPERLQTPEPVSFRPWLKSEIRRITTDLARKGGAHPDLIATMTDRGFPDAPPPIASPESTPSTATATHDDIELLYHTLMDRERLTDLHREVITALLLEERDPTTYAQEANVSPTTLRKQLSRARQRLREITGIEL